MRHTNAPASAPRKGAHGARAGPDAGPTCHAAYIRSSERALPGRRTCRHDARSRELVESAPVVGPASLDCQRRRIQTAWAYWPGACTGMRRHTAKRGASARKRVSVLLHGGSRPPTRMITSASADRLRALACAQAEHLEMAQAVPGVGADAPAPLSCLGSGQGSGVLR